MDQESQGISTLSHEAPSNVPQHIDDDGDEPLLEPGEGLKIVGLVLSFLQSKEGQDAVEKLGNAWAGGAALRAKIVRMKLLAGSAQENGAQCAQVNEDHR